MDATLKLISIHALHEESDPAYFDQVTASP